MYLYSSSLLNWNRSLYSTFLPVQTQFADFNFPAAMATATASFVAMSSASLQTATAQKMIVSRFNGLKGCHMRRRSAVISCAAESAPILRLTSIAAATPETLVAVQKIIAQQLAMGEDESPEAKFDDIGVDSLDTEQVIKSLQETLDIVFDEPWAEGILTVQIAADMIELFIE